MSRVATKGALGIKPEKRKAGPSTRLRSKSKKRAAYEASPAGQADLGYMGRVKQLPCAACGGPPPSDAHHCKCKPPFGAHCYKILPIGGKSHPEDTIPLCKLCHQDGPLSFHGHRNAWVERFGPDYGFIPSTRAAVAAMLGEIDF